MSVLQKIDGRLLRSALRNHAAGVTVLTVPGPVGFTATSFTSVSLEPPLVSFCIATGASARPAVDTAAWFAVHLLGSGQQELAVGFARSGVDRFDGVVWRPDEHGVPCLRAVPERLRCRVVHRQETGDHILVLGEVVAVDGPPDEAAGTGSSLVHHGGQILPVGSLDADDVDEA